MCLHLIRRVGWTTASTRTERGADHGGEWDCGGGMELCHGGTGCSGEPGSLGGRGTVKSSPTLQLFQSRTSADDRTALSGDRR
jgi:hypothetical protein